MSHTGYRQKVNKWYKMESKYTNLNLCLVSKEKSLSYFNEFDLEYINEIEEDKISALGEDIYFLVFIFL